MLQPYSLFSIILLITAFHSSNAIQCYDNKVPSGSQECSAGQQCISITSESANLHSILKNIAEHSFKSAHKSRCDNEDVCKLLVKNEVVFNYLETPEALKRSFPFNVTMYDVQNTTIDVEDTIKKAKEGKVNKEEFQKKLMIAFIQGLKIHIRCCNSNLCNAA